MKHVVAGVAEILEVTASGGPHLLDFQIDVMLKSPVGFAVYELASAFEVAHDEVGRTVHHACRDLDRLERRRGVWRDPATILKSPNLVALLHVCQARKNRVVKPTRQQKLGRILRRLERAHELARSRAWIEAFIGPSPEAGKEKPKEK